MSSKPIVLITGMTGYIAGVTTKAYLDAGYRVRGTSRSKRSAQPLIDTLVSQGYSADDLEVYEIADITVAGAFDEAVKGVEIVAHLASPVSLSFTDPEPILYTAKEGALSILRSTKAYGTTVKTFIQMSSIAAVIDVTAPPPVVFSENDWNDSSIAMTQAMGKNTPGAIIYLASKSESEKAVWKFRDEEKPSFNVVAILPGWVSGAPAVKPTDKSKVTETNLEIFEVFAGQDLIQKEGLSSYVHVKDVARLFVWAAENGEKANGERYLAVAGKGNNQAIRDILRKGYPDRADKIPAGNPGVGYRSDYLWDSGDQAVETSKAVKATGQDWLKYGDVVLDAAKAFEHLV